MKYARLPFQDLKDLEKEFIEFLAVNGIPAEEWERLKAEDKVAVEGIIDQFSDVVWESVLRKTEMVEFRRKNQLTICKAKEGELTTLLIKTRDENLDLTQPDTSEKVLADKKLYSIEVQKEQFTKEDTQQLFELLNAGFYISKSEVYKELFEEL